MVRPTSCLGPPTKRARRWIWHVVNVASTLDGLIKLQTSHQAFLAPCWANVSQGPCKLHIEPSPVLACVVPIFLPLTQGILDQQGPRSYSCTADCSPCLSKERRLRVSERAETFPRFSWGKHHGLQWFTMVYLSFCSKCDRP